MFPSEVGTPIVPRNFIRQFKLLLKKAGLPETTRFHDLRHTAATLMIEQRVPLKVVSDILGHTSITVTSDIYGHTEDEAKRQATEALDRLFE